MSALVIGIERDRAVFGLASAQPVRWRLDAMIGRIAHHMGQRVLDHLEDLPVELGLGAEHPQVDLLAEFEREVTHDARQLRPGIADRLHARLHNALLQLGGDM